MDQFAQFLPLILIVLVFWLLVIRPASKRQRDQRALQNALGPGDRVMLSAGIHGVVRDALEDRLMVQVADGVVLEVARAAIASRVETPDNDESRSDDRTQLPPEDLPPSHGNS